MAYIADKGECAKILFVEAEEWERTKLVEKCGCGEDVPWTAKRFENLTDGEIPDGTQILSPFVESDLSADQLRRVPELKLVATRTTGYDHIDLDYCNENGIVVSNVPDYGDNTVAEHTFALILALTRKIPQTYDRVIRGNFDIGGLRGIDLRGRTFGAIGAGNIAQHALRIAVGFSMRAIAFDIQPREELAREIGFEYVDMDQLLRDSDIVSLHVPYNEHTHHLIDADAMEKMKDTAILINTARGGIVDPQALLEALRSGKLGGAGLDVLEAEHAIGEEAELLSSSFDTDKLTNIVRSHALMRMDNVVITPHMAFNSEEAVLRIIETTVENIHRFLEDKPQNVVNDPQGVEV
ncbi:MAG: NAD(P)-dependent oxidoreductase [Planctomycetota bacterium]